MHFRPLLSAALVSTLALSACSKQEAKPYAVEEVSLAQISADLASGKATSVAVTKAYIDRIKEYDPQLHSVILVAPDALDQAAASDKRRKEGHAIGPLDGIPILFKDNIDVAGYPTTAGSYALVDNKPAQDSEVAKRLRAAGIVVLGKANTSQWAGLRTTKGFNGSTVGGSPKNPYDLTKSPAGSSPGPGISVAASLTAGAVGTDTAGSIVAPSNVNGIVGFRPTVALISRHGIVPVSSTDDMSGPMGRSVTDVAMMLNVMAGSDPADAPSKDADEHKADYVKALDAHALQGKRIGVIRGFTGYSDQTKPVLDAALEVMKAQGAEIVEVPGDMFEDMSQEHRIIMIYDIKQDMAAYLANAPAAVKTRTLADLIEFNKTEEHEKLHSQDLFEDAEATTGRDNPEYVHAAEYGKQRTGEDGYLKAMKDYNVSALVFPTGGPAGVIGPDEKSGGHPAVVHEKGARPPSGSGMAAMAGYPELNVPMGLIEGMPVGITFLAEPWSEAKLIGYGYAYEQASHARVPPAAYKKAAEDDHAAPSNARCRASRHAAHGGLLENRNGLQCGGGDARSDLIGSRRRQSYVRRGDAGLHRPHQEVRSATALGDRDCARCALTGEGLGRSPQSRQGHRSAGRYPRAAQGQHRRRRHAHHGGFLRAHRELPRQGRRSDAPPARGRRGHSRESEPLAVGGPAHDRRVQRLDLRRQPEESIRSEAHARRLELRLGRRRGRELRRRYRGHRHHRLDHRAFEQQWRRRHPPDHRAALAPRRRSRQLDSGHDRPHGPQRQGRGDDADGDGGLRSGRP